jgi:hypothetical protein
MSKKLQAFPWRKRKSLRKKFIGMGVGATLLAVAASAFIKDQERHQ